MQNSSRYTFPLKRDQDCLQEILQILQRLQSTEEKCLQLNRGNIIKIIAFLLYLESINWVSPANAEAENKPCPRCSKMGTINVSVTISEKLPCLQSFQRLEQFLAPSGITIGGVTCKLNTTRTEQFLREQNVKTTRCARSFARRALCRKTRRFTNWPQVRSEQQQKYTDMSWSTGSILEEPLPP